MTPRRNVAAESQPTVTFEPGKPPEIKFKTPVYDFGKARAGAEVVHDYEFENTGKGPLEILNVKPGCGCTTAGEHTRVVMPGETGVIPIKLKPGSNAGPVNKRITVKTNIPGKDGTITLEIKGTVWSPVQVTPRSAAFGRLTPDTLKSGMTRTLTIVNNLEEPMKPGAIKSSNSAFGGELKPVEDGDIVRIEILGAQFDTRDPAQRSRERGAQGLIIRLKLCQRLIHSVGHRHQLLALVLRQPLHQGDTFIP